jgi:hypothetical protein
VLLYARSLPGANWCGLSRILAISCSGRCGDVSKFRKSARCMKSCMPEVCAYRCRDTRMLHVFSKHR